MQYKTIKNNVNVYNKENKIVKMLKLGSKININMIYIKNKHKKIGLLDDGNYIIASFDNIDSIEEVKSNTKKGTKK